MVTHCGSFCERSGFCHMSIYGMCMICASHFLPFHSCPDLDVSLTLLLSYCEILLKSLI